MKRLSIHLIAAARPNFMKVAPIYHALKREDWAEPVIVHTGQHYDVNMSDAFFRDLGLPEPHIHLGAGSGSHAEQTARVMTAYEQVIMEKRPDLVIVVGDVNSTMACTLAAVKVVYPDAGAAQETGRRRPVVAHLEAGLRSFDRTMPEEINRLVTDSLADILWTPSPDGDENLIREGVPGEKIVRVGNIMIDSLEMLRKQIENDDTYRKYGFEKGGYGVVTLHRPSNVDRPEVLGSICSVLSGISLRIPLLFPVHPRTEKSLEETGLMELLRRGAGIRIVEPLNYLSFMNAVFNCRMVITDSGGIQEETTYIGIPCLTLRENTERPVTVTQGTNRLCSIDTLEASVDAVLLGRTGGHSIPELWDGRTAGRVVEAIGSYFSIKQP
jgi:UDP-N-acetylglucosamine 2-epimerase (non-hydrolysing)